ncbi:aminotransferase class I/II-fold pyridoxal phosphate-dependent enzyme [Ohtaekwangia koreensis]|uniref:8-amino-7-oxononanoate synthase n=1 Tax=Ohtaekwangia koreensis TaxID=688867 RepID=A0A1T5MJC4_9BACT|nr:8-amino-7-oxononanoate synthase [Ohtaekwangia koreensis]SKC88331.1 8-amino-7-oxononanoate synthase [Ohtaekwangia koreensis]
MDAWRKELQGRLKAREKEGLLRTLKYTSDQIDFSSNDYLGLSRSESLFNEIHQELDALTIKRNGATGSRLLAGNTEYYEETESRLAKIFKADASLIFNSGYTANLAVLSSLPQRNDTILYDELAHACIKDGARLSLAKRYSFRHNDLNDLEAKLKRAEGKIYIAVESIYSMDGDQCPLQELVSLSEKYNAFIILDEAHSTGVMGEQGSGLAVSLNVHSKIAVRVYTFGKAMGIHGACVAGNNDLHDYLINFARPFIYTTALPPHSIAAIDCAFKYLSNNIYLQERLRNNIQFFLHAVQDLPNRTISTSAIQTAIYPGNENARIAATELQQKGFDVRPILSPTVPKGSERLRICLHTFNTKSDIEALASTLKSFQAVMHS